MLGICTGYNNGQRRAGGKRVQFPKIVYTRNDHFIAYLWHIVLCQPTCKIFYKRNILRVCVPSHHSHLLSTTITNTHTRTNEAFQIWHSRLLYFLAAVFFFFFFFSRFFATILYCLCVVYCCWVLYAASSCTCYKFARVKLIYVGVGVVCAQTETKWGGRLWLCMYRLYILSCLDGSYGDGSWRMRSLSICIHTVYVESMMFRQSAGCPYDGLSFYIGVVCA